MVPWGLILMRIRAFLQLVLWPITVLQMTRHLAVYWASKGVRVNSLSPGPFPGPSAPKAMVQRLEQKSPMKRMGQPDELKGAIVFLASPASSYMTGQNLVIDGGWTAW